MQKPWEIDMTIYEDEAALLEGLRRHDRLACTCLLKRYAPRLYRLTLQLTANADDAEDVLQEGFIQACSRIDQFEGRSGLGTWLHRIVVNTALMRLRRRAHQTVSLPSGSDEFDVEHLPAAKDADPSEQALSSELQDILSTYQID